MVTKILAPSLRLALFLAKTSRKEGGIFSRARDYLRVSRISLDGLRKKRDCSYSEADQSRADLVQLRSQGLLG